MVDCEICGKELTRVRKSKIEGSILTVCDSCVNLGTEVQFSVSSPALLSTHPASQGVPIQDVRVGKKIITPYSREIEDFDVVDNYQELIRKAWNKSGMKLSEFSQMLNEKESVVKKLMAGDMVLSEKLAKKLEKKLKIRLEEGSVEESI